MIPDNNSNKSTLKDTKDTASHLDSNEDTDSKFGAAGTDPDRYKIVSGEEGTGEIDSKRRKEPDNHPSESERLIHPDKGE